MKTCSTVNVFVSRKPVRYSAQNKLWLNYFSCLGKLKKIPKFPGIKVCWIGSLGNLSFVTAFCQKKKIVRFSFGCLDALGQTRKQQGKSTVNARVGEKHERNFFCLFNYCLNDWKTETTCYKYFILLGNIRQKHWLWPLSYFTFSVSMQSPLLSEISQLAFIQRAQYHVENTCVAILNNPAAGF